MRIYLDTIILVVPWLLAVSWGPLVPAFAWLIVLLVISWWLLVAMQWSTQTLFRVVAAAIQIAALLSVALALLQFCDLETWLQGWISDSVDGQSYANLRQRNQFASLTTLGCLAVIAALQSSLTAGRCGRELAEHSENPIGANSCTHNTHVSNLQVNLAFIAVAWLALGNALSSSRTGAVHWMAVGVAVFLWRASLSQVVKRLAVLGFIAYSVWVSLMPWFATWVGNSSAGLLARLGEGNALSRVALWSNVLELIAQKPWLGHGWGSLAYAHYSAEFSGARFMELLDNAHNLPLHLAVELGLPVALGFCGLVVWTVWKAKPWRETQPDRQMAWGCLLVIGIHSMLEYPLWYGPFFLTAVICIGILCADLWRNWLLAQTEYARAAIILGVRGLGVALLAFTAFAAFDYHRVSQIYLAREDRSSWYAKDPLGAAYQSVLFKSHAKFAELTITPLSRESASRVLELSSELVLWSPEPRVIEALIESAVMMGVDDVAAFHLQRYRVAYPKAYADWKARMRQQPS